MLDHRDYMVQLAIKNGWKKGIELGVGSGQLLHKFLAVTNMTMIGVDLGLRSHRKEKVEGIQRAFADRCIVHFEPTSQAHYRVPEKWADFIFIDAAHSYHAVKHDIKMWLPKLKDGGWFGGHDYHEKFPGVIKAVGEAFADKFEVIPEHHIWVAKNA